VEDALFHVVDTICRREAKKEWQDKIQQKRKARSVWHPATIGFRLDPLETIKNSSGGGGGDGEEEEEEEGIPVITDMDYNEKCLVSVSGYLLPTHRPWNLFIKHENERMRQRQEEEAQEAERQLVRNQPFKEKWFKLLVLAKENPNQAFAYLAEGLKNRVLELPKKLRATDKTLLLEMLKTKTVQGGRGLVHLLRHPSEFIEIPRHVINSLYLKLFPPSPDEVALEKMIQEMTEKEAAEAAAGEGEGNKTIQQSRRKGVGKVIMQDMTPIPVTHPDAILMTILLLHDPPPVFELIPPPKWYDPALHLKKDLSEFLADVTGKTRGGEGGSSGSRDRVMRGRRKPPKYRDARSRLPLYAPGLVKKQLPVAEGRGDREGGPGDLSARGSSVEDSAHPVSPPLGAVIEAGHSEGEGDEGEGASGKERSLAEVEGSEAADSPRDAPPQDPEESSHYSGSTLTTKPPVEDPPLPPAASSNRQRQRQRGHGTMLVPAPVASNGAQSRQQGDGAGTGNALKKYQLGSLTHRLYKNYKDATVGAAPTVLEKEIFDNSRRRHFEKKLIEELAAAACIPPRFFSIEEIRRLPENDSKLLDFKKRKEDYFREQERVVAEKKRKELEEYQLTMELVKRSQMLSRQRRQEEQGGEEEKEEAMVASERDELGKPLDDHNQGLGQGSSVELPSIGQEGHEDEQEQEGGERDGHGSDQEEGEEDLDELIGETDEERRARLKASARKKSVWTTQAAPSSQQSHSPSLPPAAADFRSTSPTQQQRPTSPSSPPATKPQALLHGQIINLEPSRIAPMDVLKMGLLNPEDQLKDPKCWLANELRELTEEERQLKRFKYLEIQAAQERAKGGGGRGGRALYLLQEELVRIKRKQKELLEICQEFAQPTYEVLNRQINPVKDELVKKIGEYLKRLPARDRKGGGGVSSEKYREEQKEEGEVEQQREGEAQGALDRGPAPAAAAAAESGVDGEMIMTVHHQLLQEEQSMLADMASARMEESDQLEGEGQGEGEEGGGEVPEVINPKDGQQDEDRIMKEVKATLRQMCLAVEYHDYLYGDNNKSPSAPPSSTLVPSSCVTDIYDDYLELCDEELKFSPVGRPPDDDEAQPLIGCEISLIVHIDDSLKSHIYLRDLHSSDISSFLQHQLHQQHSKLLSTKRSPLASRILHISHKPLFQRRINFQRWEDLWVHFISPVYFRYTIKPAKPEKYNGGQSHGRLPGGLVVVNPLDQFTASQKVTYTRLPQPQPPSTADSSGGGDGNYLLDYNCDDIGKEISSTAKLTIYRPNMSSLTEYDVLKCKRIMNLFHEKYLSEMKYGLADGVRLRYGQYLALKDYKTSERIYELAKQKKARDDRGGGEGGEGGGAKITKISAEVFEDWMREAKEEEEKELKEARRQALKLKEIRRQEAEMRRKYDSQKTWFYGKIFQQQQNATIAGELASQVKDLIEEQEEMMTRGGAANATPQERQEADDYRRDMKIKLIHEEKQTRAAWEILCHRFLEEEEEKESGPGDDDLEGDAVTLPSGIRTPRQLDTPGASSHASSALPSSLPVESVMRILDLVKIRKLMDDNHRKFLMKKELKEKERLKREKRKQQQERAMKLREVHGITTVSHATEAQSESQSVSEAMDDQLSVGSIEKHEGSLSSVTHSPSPALPAVDVSSASSSPAPAAAVVIDDGDGYSTMSEPLKKFSEEVRQLDPLDLPAAVTMCRIWRSLLISLGSKISSTIRTSSSASSGSLLLFRRRLHGPLLFPSFPPPPPPLTIPVDSRDELVQFAKMNVEVAPIIFRAKDAVRQANEEKIELKENHQKRAKGREKKKRHLQEQEEEERRREGREEMTEEMIYQKMLEEGLAEEASRRRKNFKKAEKRRLKREKAWLYAHQHMYVKIKGFTPYCAVCREKHDQHWLENFLEHEKVYQQQLEERLVGFKEMKEAEVREELEAEHMAKIEKDRQERVKLLRGIALEAEEEEREEKSVKKSISLGGLSSSSFQPLASAQVPPPLSPVLAPL
jgi:hypothetical protein